jgi:hypothetical protein
MKLVTLSMAKNKRCISGNQRTKQSVKLALISKNTVDLPSLLKSPQSLKAKRLMKSSTGIARS